MPHDIQRARHLARRQRCGAKPRGVEIGGQKDGEIKQQRRYGGGGDHVGVGELQELRHQERRRAHDRRHDLAAGGGDGLVGGGAPARKAGLFHHRDGENAGGGDIGHGAAGDGAEQTGGDDGDLGGAAAVAADQAGGEIGEPGGAAGALEQLPEDYEDDDHRADDR